MGLSEQNKKEIEDFISDAFQKKINEYSPETKYMPFLERLIQTEKLVTYSFMHSISTFIGQSIYEEVSKMIATEYFDTSITQYKAKQSLSKEQENVIQKIMTELGNKERTPDIKKEIEEVLSVSNKNGKPKKDGLTVDLYLEKDNKEYLIEIKTVKPNKSAVIEHKKKLLEWVAREGKTIKPYMAMPYNPYYPEPYKRFTTSNYIKVDEDLLVGEKYWDFLGGEGTFKDLLQIFDKVGKNKKEELNKKIKEIASRKLQ